MNLKFCINTYIERGSVEWLFINTSTLTHVYTFFLDLDNGLKDPYHIFLNFILTCKPYLIPNLNLRKRKKNKGCPFTQTAYNRLGLWYPAKKSISIFFWRTTLWNSMTKFTTSNVLPKLHVPNSWCGLVNLILQYTLFSWK